MKYITLSLMLLLSSYLNALDADRELALKDVLAGIERLRNEQLNSTLAKTKPELKTAMNELFDRIASDYKRDIYAQKITPGSQVDKDIKSRENGLKHSRDTGKEKAAAQTEKVIKYLKWLVGDPAITEIPDKVVVY
jgi:hypothetical protein